MDSTRSTPLVGVPSMVRRVVIFVHGLLFDGSMWDRLVVNLGPGLRCERPSLPGHGGTPPPPEVSGYAVDKLAEGVLSIIEKYGDAIDFVGFSLGGFIGLRIAISRPEVLRTLTLIATSADAEPPEAVRRYRGLLRLAGVPVLGARLANQLLLPELLGRPFGKDHPDLARAIKTRLNSNPLSVVKPATEAVISRACIVDQVSRIRVPTLCIAGGDDKVRPVADLEEIASRIPGAELVVIPAARHLVPYTHPDAVATAIRSFLDGTRRSRNDKDATRRPD